VYVPQADMPDTGVTPSLDCEDPSQSESLKDIPACAAKQMPDGNKQTSDGKTQTEPRTYVHITEEELSVNDVMAKVADTGCGGISIFVGTTRDLFAGKEVVRLEYESYAPMALREMKKLCDETRGHLSVVHLALVHRLGEVKVGEASIIVAASSVHRKEANAATSRIMDVVKERVPVWKKEVYSDGSKSWKENKECKWKTDNS